MQVLQMRLAEQVCVDQERLSSLYAQLGKTAAEEVVCRAMEELALRMSHCYSASSWDERHKKSRSLIAISDQVGLQKLASVAGDVMRTINQKDKVAVSTTLTRLIRIGEPSLMAIGDTQDMSI
jgi:hypothetical protein